jgi:hypothetical protein
VAVIETRARIALRRGDAAAERQLRSPPRRDRGADRLPAGAGRRRLIDLQLASVERRFRDAVERTPRR